MSETLVMTPYPGPRPFQSDECDIFFGRGPETRDLFSYVAAHRAVLLYATSGAGKTSLINAGVIPELRKAGFDVLPSARVVAGTDTRTTGVRNIFVYNAALNWLSDPAETLEQSTLSDVIRRYPRERGSNTDDPRVIFFDQFEEIFTSHLERWQDRQPFFEELASTLDEDPLLHAVLILREDYLAQLEPFAPMLPNRLRNRMRLELLDEDAALEAITEPMEKLGRRFTPGVAEMLVRDLLRVRVEVAPGKTVEVTGEHVEPVQLQVVCRSLWQAMGKDDTVRPEHVKAIGDIDGILGTFYDNAISAAAAKAGMDEITLRTWCETELITTLGTRGTVYRGPEMTGSAPNAAVDELQAHHLIRPERRAGARWYELTHDRLIDPIRASNRQHLTSRKEYVLALEYVSKAQDKWRRGRYEEAISDLSEAKRYAELASAYDVLAYVSFYIGSIAVDAKLFDDAITHLQVSAALYAAAEQPDQLARVLGVLGFAMKRLERYDEAIEFLTQALAFSKDEEQLASLYDSRGGAYWYSGQLPLAIDDYNEAIAHDPKNVDAYNGRGQVYADLKQYDHAVEDLSHLIENAEQTRSPLLIAYALNGRGHAYGGLQKWPEAMADFSASLAIAPNNAWAFFNRARVHHWKGDQELALADLRTSLVKNDPSLNPVKRNEAEAILAGRERWPS